jgi:hypothetical protein
LILEVLNSHNSRSNGNQPVKAGDHIDLRGARFETRDPEDMLRKIDTRRRLKSLGTPRGDKSL